MLRHKLRIEPCTRRCHHRAALRTVPRRLTADASYGKQWRRKNDQHQERGSEFEGAGHDLGERCAYLLAFVSDVHHGSKICGIRNGQSQNLLMLLPES